MGSVSVIAKIFPTDPSKLEDIKAAIAAQMRLADSRVEDVGFGAKILRIMVVLPDAEGGDIEDRLKRISGVSQVQIEDVSLVM